MGRSKDLDPYLLYAEVVKDGVNDVIRIIWNFFGKMPDIIKTITASEEPIIVFGEFTTDHKNLCMIVKDKKDRKVVFLCIEKGEPKLVWATKLPKARLTHMVERKNVVSIIMEGMDPEFQYLSLKDGKALDLTDEKVLDQLK